MPLVGRTINYRQMTYQVKEILLPIHLITLNSNSGSGRPQQDSLGQFIQDMSRNYQTVAITREKSGTKRIRALITETLFASFLSTKGFSTDYLVPAIKAKVRSKELPSMEAITKFKFPEYSQLRETYSDAHKKCETIARGLVRHKVFIVSGSEDSQSISLASTFKKYGAFGLTAFILTGGLLAGVHPTPMIVMDAGAYGTGTYFVITVGSAVADRIADAIRPQKPTKKTG